METESNKIIRLETKMDNIEKTVERIETTLNNSVVRLETVFDEFRKECDEKFASKKTETMVYAIITTIITGFVAALWAIINKKI